MMQTPSGSRALIEAMVSPEAFEALATDVLRRSTPAYRRLGHVGVNAGGRTVRSPVDGLAIDREAGQRVLIVAQYTTTATRGLRAKWLDSKAGDAVKSLAILNAERDRSATDKSVLILATSHEPSDKLVRDVNALAGREIDVDIWGPSRLAGYLDHDPEGQWLRKIHLGAPLTRLGVDLLREIGARSIQSYLAGVEVATLVPRAFDLEFEEQIERQAGASFLAGPSGGGKSVACRRLGERWMDRGGVALVISHEVVESSASIAQALATALSDWEPSLGMECGVEALSLAPGGLPFLVIVEDVNRSTNPVALIERLLTWSLSNISGDTPMDARWRLVCPLWRSKTDLVGPSLLNTVEARILDLPAFTRSEAAAAVRARAETAGLPLTELQIGNFAAEFGDDPLLIGLNENWLAPSAGMVLQDHIQRSLIRAADKTALPVELSDALQALMAHLLDCRDLDPSWSDLKVWLDAIPERNAVRRLLADEQIVRLKGSPGRQMLAFRHDRLRDHLLATELAARLDENRLEEALWSDPYLSGLIGSILGDRSAAVIERTTTLNPVAVFAALRTTLDARRRSLIDTARSWLKRPENASADRRSQMVQVMNELRRTDGDFVLEFAQLTTDGGWWRVEARLRNGDVTAGADLCRSLDHSMPASFRDRLIAHAAKRHPTFKSTLAAFLATPQSEDHPLFAGALDLAGHLGDPDLCDALETAWRHKPSADRLNSFWFWAIIACGVERAHPLVEEICSLWAELPDKADDERENPRWDLAYSIGSALVRRSDDRIFDFLIALAGREPRLESPIVTILKSADSPAAVAFVCRTAAKYDAKAARSRGINFLGSDLDRLWDKGSFGRRMSQASRDALEALWSRRSNARFLRRRALRMWGAQLRWGDIAKLARLTDDPNLANEALRIRLNAADESAKPFLREKLLAGEGNWWWSARELGLVGLEDCVTHHLDLRRAAEKPRVRHGWDDHILAELVMDRADAWSEAMILSHWDHLQGEDAWLEAALFVGGSELLAKAHAAIAAREEPGEAVKYLVMHWGLRTNGRPGITRLAQLEALEPLLGGMKEMDLGILFRSANQIEAIDWRRRHIDPLMGSYTQQSCPDLPGAFEASLDDVVSHSGRMEFQLRYWFEARLGERRTPNEIMAGAKRWALQRGTADAARCLVELIAQFGARVDLKRLEGLDYSLEGDLEAEVANTRFVVRTRSFT